MLKPENPMPVHVCRWRPECDPPFTPCPGGSSRGAWANGNGRLFSGSLFAARRDGLNCEHQRTVPFATRCPIAMIPPTHTYRLFDCCEVMLEMVASSIEMASRLGRCVLMRYALTPCRRPLPTARD